MSDALTPDPFEVDVEVEIPFGDRGDHDRHHDEPHDPFGWVGHAIGGKYAIESVVGEGGFAVVYRARHPGFAERVAVKCLKVPPRMRGRTREAFRERFLAEGRVLHQVSRATADVVQALDVGEETSPAGVWTPYLVLEWLEGKPLSVDLRERRDKKLGGRSLVDAVALLEPAARALAVAHEQGVAHLDVKPHNLFLAEVAGHPTLKIVDFGIAKGLARFDARGGPAPASASQMTSLDEILLAFTPRYGAPEQFSPRYGTMGTWTDVYALALVLVEAVTGEPALGNGDPGGLYLRTSDLVRRPTLRAKGAVVSDAVEMVLLRALAVDPRRRFDTAGAFWDALVAAVPEIIERRRSIRPPSSIVPAVIEVEVQAAKTEQARAARRRVGALAGAAVGLVASAAACVFLWTGVGGRGASGAGATGTTTTSPAPGAGDGAGAGAGAGATAAATAANAATERETARAAAAAGAAVGAAMTTSPAGDGAGTPAPPAGMAFVPPGTFVMGAGGAGAHPVELTRGFFLDATEVTAREYAACVASGACSVARVQSGDASRDAVVTGWCNANEPSRGAHPANCVTAAQATAYCAHAGKRLPTEAEWEWAARGADAHTAERAYPWGAAAPKTCATAIVAGVSGACAHKGTSEVGQTAEGKSVLGVFDLAGNVWEWVADGYAPYESTPARDPSVEPAAGSGSRGVVRGGSWDYAPEMAKTTTRMAVPRTAANVSTGFRCAKDAR